MAEKNICLHIRCNVLPTGSHDIF